MTERTGRVAAPAALALFVLLGIPLSGRSLPVATALAVAAIVVAVLLAWRRLTGWPLAAAVLLPTATIVGIGHAGPANLSWMGLCVLAAWVALTSEVAVALVATMVFEVVIATEFAQQTEEPAWFAWAVGSAFTAVASGFARRLRVTVEQLRAAQAELSERSRAEERARIAAEVHDVIGHALTVSLLHIGSARLAVDEEPDEARRALAEAERLTRESLEEVRATVGLMRSDAPDQRTPLPGAGDIPQLVESFRTAGAPIELDVEGSLPAVGPSSGLAAYRIVQEALTNATRHAPGAAVQVRVMVSDHRAAVTVRNGGTPDPAAQPGSGVRGMRERAEGLGGRLAAGPTGDGWLVEAILPA